ncbi:hypothetical protein RFI_10653 [Reticulomyxa filosa]|uniref:Uncharacterized protein n=1 Tax=Reticulomyxa filosa TaxID=46433 RepID=X6NKP8_RETFI|nr:hypothetical protein RFI_10653 [Reticulomyxa filosa]|eukprot:ETO26483.1 hypothetical protein RFI_10653 [Reticulomyxa filosa]
MSAKTCQYLNQTFGIQEVRSENISEYLKRLALSNALPPKWVVSPGEVRNYCSSVLAKHCWHPIKKERVIRMIFLFFLIGCQKKCNKKTLFKVAHFLQLFIVFGEKDREKIKQQTKNNNFTGVVEFLSCFQCLFLLGALSFYTLRFTFFQSFSFFCVCSQHNDNET